MSNNSPTNSFVNLIIITIGKIILTFIIVISCIFYLYYFFNKPHSEWQITDMTFASFAGFIIFSSAIWAIGRENFVIATNIIEKYKNSKK